jgi:hypothetical protein
MSGQGAQILLNGAQVDFHKSCFKCQDCKAPLQKPLVINAKVNKKKKEGDSKLTYRSFTVMIVAE